MNSKELTILTNFIGFGSAGYLLESMCRRNGRFSATRCLIPIYGLASFIKNPLAVFAYVLIAENIGWFLADDCAKWDWDPRMIKIGHSSIAFAGLAALGHYLFKDFICDHFASLFIFSVVTVVLTRKRVIRFENDPW